MEKQGTTFWKCWRSKFESTKPMVQQVDGVVDIESTADYFAEYFSRVCTHSTDAGSTRLKNVYETMRAKLCWVA